MKIGDNAPNFTLKDQNGNDVNLSSYLGKRVALFFYPKDNTLICTKEACSFRDSYSEFQEHNTEVIGVSEDSEKSHEGFAAKHKLPYLLLQDKNGKVAQQFGVKKILGFLNGRESFLIDENGKIIAKETARLGADAHVNTLMAALKKLR